MVANYLDTDQAIGIIDKETGLVKATPYFEDLYYNTVVATGGEGSDTITTVLSSVQSADKVPYIQGLVMNLRRKVAELDGSADKIPYFMGLVVSLKRKVSELETSLSTSVVEATVRQLLIDTARFDTKVKNVNYTPKNREYIEAQSNAIISLPENAISGDQIMVANDDGTFIRVSGNGNKIKYTTEADTFNIVKKGSSKHFHFFVDNANNVGHWRAR